jgi:serine/threonine protein kinase
VDHDIQGWQRLEELFAEAVDLPPETRAAFIDRETGGDTELRRQLFALLEHDTNAGARISRAIGGAARAATAPVDWAGKRFGPYRIVREIGRGGMGMVFEALRDDDEYRKTVALKIAPFWCDLDLLRERFRHERQILAGLEHPNIARFLDGGTEDGVPYFAMEYISGRPITEYARGLKLRETIALFQQVCSAVHYAHQSLLVHRDLKPGNILVNDEGIPKLLDFGIAKLLSPFEDAGRNTMTGTAPWTPDYASPEQVRGRPITTRTDIYSLGLILFELLAGVRGQVADNSSPLALDRSICEAEVPAPSTRAPQAMRRQLAGDLDNIVLMATHKEPDRRYASVAQFSEDLQRYLDGRPVAARKDSAAYRISKFVRRNWLPVTAGGVTALTLVVGAIAFAWEAHLAESRFNQVRTLATGFLFEVHDKVQNIPEATAVREMLTKTAVDTLGTLSRDAGRNYALRRELAAAYLRLGTAQGSTTGSSRGRNAQALASFELGLSLLNGLPASDVAAAEPTEAGLREGRGRILTSLNRPAEAELDLKRSLEIRRSLCREPLKQKDACMNCVNSIMALAEWSIRQRHLETTEHLITELDQRTEALRPALSETAWQRQWLRNRIFAARAEWLRAGARSAADKLLPAFPAAEKLVAANPTDKEAIRVGLNYCEQLGAILLEATPASDPQLDRILHLGVDWSEQLVRLDETDQRPHRQLAGALGALGNYVSRENPSRGAAYLQQSVDRLLDQMRLSPNNFDNLAMMVDYSDHMVQALARLHRDQEAASALLPVLEYYDPLMAVGLKLTRSEPARQIQALAWVAQAGAAARRSGSGWYRDAARRTEAALASSPRDPALQAAAALFYASVPGSPEERSQWSRQAGALWQSIAAQFPGNKAVLDRAKAAADAPQPFESHTRAVPAIGTSAR